jgi:hypothetical protein
VNLRQGVISVKAGVLVQCSADCVLLGACYNWVLVCSCGWIGLDWMSVKIGVVLPFYSSRMDFTMRTCILQG